MLPGLIGRSATFQHLITGVLGGLLFENVLSYIVELLICSKSYSEHLHDIEKVFNLLGDANLKLHPLQCRWAFQELSYLGLRLSSARMTPDRERTAAINTFPRPTTQKELARFLQLICFYRRFLRGFVKSSGFTSPFKQADNLNGLLLVKKHF